MYRIVIYSCSIIPLMSLKGASLSLLSSFDGKFLLLDFRIVILVSWLDLDN